MITVNISLTEEMKAFLEAQAAEEGYPTVSEYLYKLIHEARKQKARQELDAQLKEGLEGPASEMTDAEWAALRQRIK